MATTLQTDPVGLAAMIAVALSWIVFALIFFLRKKPLKGEEAKRAPVATAGIVLQGVGFAVVWTFRRSRWWPFPESLGGELLLAATAVILAWGSNLWCLQAVQTLGKQWTVAARVIHGHELVTHGPYHVVRNPIYLGMFGLLLATGLVVSTWWALLGEVVVFLIGSRIRIRAEERLLREAFGSQFDEYAQRVPAFLPRIR